jgi:hypothetical protein
MIREGTAIMRNKTLQTITVLAGVLSALCLIAYGAALHDVFQDYVSPRVIQENVSGSPSLPAWTACSLEWKIVRICFWPMVGFHAIFLVGLIRNRNRKEE